MKNILYRLLNSKAFAYIAAAVWSLIVVFSFMQWNSYISKNIYELAVKEARTNFNKDVNYRRWNAKEGGVYVNISDYTMPNKYLDVPDRDVETKDGKKLTLVNPAYMTRLVHESEFSKDGISGHITSLKPIRPKNKADKWETKALNKFEKGIKEYSSLVTENGVTKLRYMAPLFTEKPCLKCHAKQGYKVGDIRGGISIDIPYRTYLTDAAKQKKRLLIFHLIIGIIGLTAIYVVSKVNRKHKSMLKQSEEMSRAVLNALPDIIFVLDKDCNFQKYYAPEQDLYSAPEMFLGKNIKEVLPPNIAKLTLEGVNKVLSEKQNHAFEYSLEIGNELHFFEARLTLKSDTEVLTIIRNVTEQKKAEKELKANEEKYRKTFATSPDAITISKLENGVYISINKSFTEILGYSEEEAIGKSALELNIWENNKDREKVFSEFKTKGVVKNFEAKFRTKSGDIKIGLLSASVIELDGLPHLLSIARDITAWKTAEDKLRQSEEKFRKLSLLKKAILESPEGIVVFALDNNYCYLDFTPTHKRTMQTLWGTDVEIGKNMLQLISNKEDRRKAKENFDRALSGEKFALFEDYGNEKLNRLFYENRYSPILDEEDQIIGISVYVIDITERRKAQQIIEDMLKDLEIGAEELKNKNLELENTRNATLNLIEDLEFEIDERKRIEADLKASEERHRLISDLTSDYIFQAKTSENGEPRMFWVAGAFEKITGYTLDEYNSIGGWRAVLHPDDVKLDRKAFEKINKNQKSTVELRIINRNGSVIWVRSHGLPIWDYEKNRLAGIIGATTDITEEKQNNLIQQIQYNIANAVVTANSIKDLISVVKSELSKIINTNELYIAFYDETTGMFKMDVYEDSQDKTEIWEARKSVSGYVMKKGKSILFNKKEILQLAESGEIDIIGTLPELWLGVPLRINGKNIGIIAAQSYDNPKAFDISNKKALEIIANQLALFIERKRAEEETIRLSRAIIQSPVSVIITDYSGTIEYVNPKFTEITGFTLPEALGLNPNILKSGEQSKEFYENLWTTILSGKNWKGEFHNKKKNGELYWENALISPIVNDEGKITHFVAIKEDITEKKIMLEELTSAKEKAESSEKVKTEFLAQMSHEIRSPLNVILNFVSLIKSEMGSDVSEDIQFGFQSIDSSSKRIIRTIDLILNMTDLQAGTYEKSIREFDAERSISTLVAEYKQSAATKNIELKQSFNFSTMKIYSDEYAVSQILSNLIDNAIKYTDKGHVELTAKLDEKEGLIISVADTGIGISKEFLPKLFSTFTQEEQGYTRSYDGNGLGMALVKRYCDLINAKISVKSKKGKGTTFTVVFPDLKSLKFKEKG